MDPYSENILDHYKYPRNKGEIPNATISITEHNPSCGDKIRVDLLLNNENKIEAIKFSGEGCAISQAAISMLTETVIGKTADELAQIKNEEIYEMLGVPISPGRVKCALLGLAAIKTAATKHTQQ